MKNKVLTLKSVIIKNKDYRKIGLILYDKILYIGNVKVFFFIIQTYTLKIKRK